MERNDIARAEWQPEMETVDASTIVFLDETSTQTVMTRRQGRAPRGTRVVGAVPRNHGPNVTCLMAIGPVSVLAPCVFEGAVDGALFLQWLTEWLVPTLPSGTTVVLDNLSVHRSPAVRAVIEAAGCHVCYLPAYSPDFNPIELVFAKLKTHLRGVSGRAFDPLGQAIGSGLDRITATDLAGYYRHCGFPLPPSAEQPSCNPL